MFTMHINKDQRGLLYRDGDFVRVLRPGRYLRLPFSGTHVAIVDTCEPFPARRNLSLYLEDRQLADELEVVEVRDGELVLHYVDDRFREVLTPGRYAFWKVLEVHRFVTVNREQAEIKAGFVEPAVLELPALKQFVREYRVEGHEKGLLFYDGVFERLLEPGVYRFWAGPAKVEVRTVDLRAQQLELTGQELMTKDKVTLRLNFVAQFRIVDALKLAAEVRDHLHQLYVVLQLILREYSRSAAAGRTPRKKRGDQCLRPGTLRQTGAVHGCRRDVYRRQGCDPAGRGKRDPEPRFDRGEKSPGEPDYPARRNGIHAFVAEHGTDDGRQPDAVPIERTGVPGTRLGENRFGDPDRPGLVAGSSERRALGAFERRSGVAGKNRHRPL